MKRLILLGCILASISPAEDMPDWKNPAVNAREKEPARATSMPYATAKQAVEGKSRNSSYAQDLNGMWKFQWSPNPDKRPENFHNLDFDVSKWKEIPVPANWQMHGYDTAVFAGTPGAGASGNPVGSYRREFEVPTDWDGRRIFLTFDGVDAACYVWVNGTRVGYSEDSRTPAEFDITEHVVVGPGNVLAVEVYRYCDGSKLEGQELWQMSGIFRNVTLWSAPRAHLRDFFVRTDLDDGYRDADVTVETKIRNQGKAPATGNITITLYNRNDKLVPIIGQATLDYKDLPAGDEIPLRTTFKVLAPAKWSAETPVLYTMVMEHANNLTPHPEFRSCRVGFREIDIKDGVFRVNGRAVKLKGVNRPEYEPATGNMVTEAMMIEDIKLLKQANANHVRTAHYPDDPRWLELCDEFGIYLTGEANIDTPDAGPNEKATSANPAWLIAYLDRVMGMVERDKNHPCVVIWSLANRSSAGPNLVTANNAVKERDPTRLTHFTNFGSGDDNPCDINSLACPPSNVLLNTSAKATGKPTYLSDFTHASGNTMGGFDDNWKIIMQSPCLMGGAMTDWQDLASSDNQQGKPPGASIGGGIAAATGIVDANRHPKPSYAELKHAFQNITITRDNQGRFTITNHHAFTNLSELDFRLRVLEDGREIWNGSAITPDCPPGKSVPFDAAPPTLPLRVAGAEQILHVGMQSRQPTTWADAGHELAFVQFPQTPENPGAPPPADATPATIAPLKLDDGRDALTVTGADFTIVWSKSNGLIKTWRISGKDIIHDGNGPSLWAFRAPHVQGDDWAASGWTGNHLDKLANVSAKLTAKQDSGGYIRVSVDARAEGGKGGLAFTQNITTTVTPDGALLVDQSVQPQGPAIVLPRMGIRFFVPADLGTVRYYGRGPTENYPDRKLGSPFGFHTSPIKDMLTPYLKPMDCGNREETRWLAVQAADGSGILAIAGAKPFSFTALPNTDDQLVKATSHDLLPQNPFNVIFLGVATLGVGSAPSGAPPPEQDPLKKTPTDYRVSSTPATISYTLRPLAAGTTDATLSAIARKPMPARMPPVMITRDPTGLVSITNPIAGATVLYSVNGEKPKPYTLPFPLPGGGNVRGLARLDGMLEISPTSVDFPAVPKRALWLIAEASSSEGTFEQSQPAKLIDGNPTTHWHTRYSTLPLPPFPHFITVKLDSEKSLAGVILTQRATPGNGRVKGVQVSVSPDGRTWTDGLTTQMADLNTPQRFKFPKSMRGQFVRITCTSSHLGTTHAALAEFDIIEGNP